MNVERERGQRRTRLILTFTKPTGKILFPKQCFAQEREEAQ